MFFAASRESSLSDITKSDGITSLVVIFLEICTFKPLESEKLTISIVFLDAFIYVESESVTGLVCGCVPTTRYLSPQSYTTRKSIIMIILYKI